MADKEISLSTAESNKLREKLGLKKLNEGAEKKRHETVLHDPEAPKPKPSEEKDRKDQARGKRAREETTGGGGILDGDEGDVGDWVHKMRSGRGAKPAEAPAPAAKRARGDKGEDHSAIDKMTVKHNIEDIQDGETLELTLQDKPILSKDGELQDDDDHALENAQLKARFNAERSKAMRGDLSADIDPDAPESMRNYGMNKYDERPGEASGFSLSAPRLTVAEKLNVLNAQHESLQKDLKYQSDYLTTAEIQARAPKKKPRKRKKIETDEKDDVTVKIDPKVKKQLADMEEVNSDEEDAWLYEQLSRQRRMQRKDEADSGVKKEMGAASLLEVVEKKELKEAEVQLQPTAPDTANTKANADAQLTGTTQFTKAVQTAAEKLESRRHESYTGALQFKQQQLQRQRRGARAGLAKKKDEDEDEEQTKQEQEETRENLSEKVLDGTAASAIAFLRSRNEIQKDQDNHRAKEKDLQPLEMGTEKNAIRLETRDEFGRVMTPKQAFQQLSWVFHGKRPGAKNEMKRLLRLENELKMRATDVEKSLPTMRALRKVQGGEAKAHIVLTSGNA